MASLFGEILVLEHQTLDCEVENNDYCFSHLTDTTRVQFALVTRQHLKFLAHEHNALHLIAVKRWPIDKIRKPAASDALR